MLSALIIVFREVLEAGLIIGIVWAVARGLAGARGWIMLGLAGGILGSALVALFTSAIANAFSGYGQEIFNATVLGTAVVMLGWHTMWMAHHGRTLAAEVRQVGQDVVGGKTSFVALAVIVGMAVLREGSEVVLFLYGVAVAGGETVSALIAGGLLGIATGGLVSWLTYRGLLSIPMRYFFSVTNWLITLLAAGMAAQSVSYLESAGVINVLGDAVWDSSGLLSETSIVGRIMHTLVGYTDQPSGAQLVAYIAVVAIIWAGSSHIARRHGHGSRKSPAAV